MGRKRYVTLILILGSLTALVPFSVDMYLPGFPAIARDFHTDVSRIGLTLSGFFIGISFGQLLYGPLLDRYGRKKPLYFGICLYILASIGCARSNSIEMLIVWRVVEAVGGCAASVASVAMVRDIFPVEDNAKVFALLMLVLGASPMIAPTVGAYITSTIGWQPVFLILAALALLIMIAVWLFLPESSAPDPSFSLRPKFIIRNFLDVLRQPVFYTYAASGAFTLAGLLTYVSGSPVLFMEVFKTGEKTYGWIFAILSVGLIGASNLNSLALKRFSSQQVIRAAFATQCAIGLILVGGMWLGLLGLSGTIVLIFLFLCCVGFLLPNTSALAMSPFDRNAGSASSLMGAAQMGFGSAATIILSGMNAHDGVPVTLLMAIIALCGFAVFLLGSRKIYQKQKLINADT